MATGQNNSNVEESFSNSPPTKPDSTLQIILDLQKDLKSAADSLRLELLGIHKEIEEIKSTVSILRDSIDFLCDRKALSEPLDSAVGAITSGLDLLQKTPQHLRRTLQVILQLNKATASQVAERTGKSRSLESDYLNQLTSLGILTKETKGKEKLFLHEPSPSDENDLEDSEEDTATTRHIQQMQQTVRDSKE